MIHRNRVKLMMSLFLTLFVGIFFVQTGCVYVSGKGLLDMGPGPLKETLVSGKGKDKILVMEVRGLITGRERGGLFSIRKEPSLVSSIKEQLDKAAEDNRIRSILLLIDSPGGTVTASDVIYHELKEFKKKNNVNIHAFFLGTGASGAYLVALAADQIIASPTTVTGSIGVIMLDLNLTGLMDKVGVRDTSIKSGKFKDIGSPFRKPTAEDEKILQGVVDEQYQRFCKIVEENRHGIDLADHPTLADGRIFTGEQALKVGLVDEVGYLPEVLEGMKRVMGVKEARVVRYVRAGDYEPNLYAMAAGALGGGGDINLIKFDLESLIATGGPQFMYLWLPGL